MTQYISLLNFCLLIRKNIYLFSLPHKPIKSKTLFANSQNYFLKTVNSCLVIEKVYA